MYDLGVKPDWWKLEPIADLSFWTGAGDIAREHDPHIQGIIVLGKDMPDEELGAVLGRAPRTARARLRDRKNDFQRCRETVVRRRDR